MSNAAPKIVPPDSALTEVTLVIHRAARYSSATLHEAMGKRGALPFQIKPLDPHSKLCGFALTVSTPPLNNLVIHKAIYAAQPGDILVVEVGGAREAGYWGDIMTTAARVRKIGGLVIDGCVRDGELIRESGLPVFARGLAIRGTDKQNAGSINHPITIGEILIRPGDLIVGDGDGVVVIPRDEIAQVLDAAQKREEKEASVRKELAEGKSTLEIYGWR